MWGQYPVQGVQPWVGQPWLPEGPGRPRRVVVSDAEIVSRRLRRGDQERFTYFYVQPLPFTADGRETSLSEAGDPDAGGFRANPYVDEAGVDRFGFIQRIVELPFVPRVPRPAMAYDDSPSVQQVTRDGATRDLCRDINGWMVATHVHANTLLRGELKMKGNPDVTVGDDLFIPETGELFYVEAVRHDWNRRAALFQTTAGVSRGFEP